FTAVPGRAVVGNDGREFTAGRARTRGHTRARPAGGAIRSAVGGCRACGPARRGSTGARGDRDRPGVAGTGRCTDRPPGGRRGGGVPLVGNIAARTPLTAARHGRETVGGAASI